MIALLLLLAAVVLLSHHVASSALTLAWVEKISAIAFILLGALLMRVAISRR
jgi:hypothetical protein